MDRETWQVTVHGAAKNQTWLRYWALHIYVKQGMCVWACSVLSHSATPLTVAHQAPLSMEFSRQENFLGILLEWVAISCSRVFSQPRDGTHVSCVSCIGRGILYHCATCEALIKFTLKKKKVYSALIYAFNNIYYLHTMYWGLANGNTSNNQDETLCQVQSS